jgi:hypothetical protein
MKAVTIIREPCKREARILLEMTRNRSIYNKSIYLEIEKSAFSGAVSSPLG